MLSVHTDMVSSNNTVCTCYNTCASVVNLAPSYVILDVCVLWYTYVVCGCCGMCVCDRCVPPMCSVRFSLLIRDEARIPLLHFCCIMHHIRTHVNPLLYSARALPRSVARQSLHLHIHVHTNATSIYIYVWCSCCSVVILYVWG